MLVDGEEEQRRRLPAEVGEIAALESRIRGKSFWQIEAEGELALKPGFDRVPVGGNYLRRCVCRERGDVLVACLGNQRGRFAGDERGLMRVAFEDEDAGEDQQQGERLRRGGRLGAPSAPRPRPLGEDGA